MLGDSTDKVSRNFDGMGRRMARLATGAAAVGLVKQVGEMEREMTRLGIASNQSDQTIKQLKDDIFAAATSPDIRVDPSQIISAIKQILEMTGDFEFAKSQIRNLGIALQATGADGKTMGGMFAEIEKSGIKTEKAVAQVIGTLAKQGKGGAFLLPEFASMGPRLISGYAAVGRFGQMAIRELGAVAQVVRGTTGSSEQATTSIEALLRVFSDAKKIAGLKKAGIQVFDLAELKKGHEVLRPLNELMADIIKMTKGRATVIQGLLGEAEAVRAFGNSIKEYKETGDVKSLERFMQMTDDGTSALQDSQRAANDSAAAMTELYAVLQKFSDDSLTGPIHHIADELKSLMNDYKEFKVYAGQIVGYVNNAHQKAVNFTSGVIEAGVNSLNPSMSRPDNADKAPLQRRAIPGSGGYVPYTAPGIQNLGRDSQAAAPTSKPIDGEVNIKIESDMSAKVTSLKANSGVINVKNTRAGAHFQ